MAPMNGPVRSATTEATTTIAAVIAIFSVSSSRTMSPMYLRELEIRGIWTWLADGRECCTQLPAGAIENACCLLQLTAMQKQDG